MTPAARAIAAGALVAASCLVAAPPPAELAVPASFVQAALDPALRVPESAAWLAGAAGLGLESGDRVLALRLDPEGRPLPDADRAALYRALRGSSVREVRADVAHGGERTTATVVVARERPLDRLARAWPLIAAAATLLAFGFFVAAGSSHPCAAPLFALSWCLGSALLGELDRLLPEVPGALLPGVWRARLGAFALALLPATFLHLAARFPVVSLRFRGAPSAALPYAAWLPAALIAPFRLHDAAFQAAVERIALGASVAAAGLLAVACATAARRLTAIERARTRALVAGLVAGGAGPALLHATAGRAPGASILGLLALPGALAWAVARFRLLDPAPWLERALLGGATGVLAILLTAGALGGGLSLLGVAAAEARAVLPFALSGAIAAVLGHGLLRRAATLRVRSDRDAAHVIERAVRELAESRTSAEVLERIAERVRRALEAPVAVLSLADDPRGAFAAAPAGTPLPRLAASGLALWRSAGEPPRGVLRCRAQAADPSPDRAELVAWLRAGAGPDALVVVGGRPSGLPYDDTEERLLETLRHVAATALGAAAAASDLEARVCAKTAELARGLRDRQRVLEAAEGISAAEDAAEVLARLEAFADAEEGTLRWSEGALAARAPAGTLGGTIAAPAVARRTLVVSGLAPERVRELAPQLDALCAFAGIALARLALLTDLKREVEAQAVELGENRSRRLHAEFVRGVAHELRKPLEELRRRVEGLPPDAALEADRTRLRALGRELARRLDLLLFHSGIRLDRRRTDLARLADEAVAAARAIAPARDFWVSHEPPSLPVLGDPTRLASVMENLLDNAVKATAPGQRIVLRTRLERARPELGPRAVVEVEDEGSGVEPACAARIFEPGVAFAPGGFGLGLSLCREIVRLHGGAIELDSRPGRTLFRVRIPLFAAPPPEAGG
jgi:signal transduction histidine kinase